MTDLHSYLATSGQLPADALLGHIVMFTVHRGEFHLTDITATATALGLSAKPLPSLGRPVDAFKKATHEADDFEYQLPTGDVAHVLVRDVETTREMVTRHLVREIRDSKRRRLAYSKVGDAVFYKPVVRGGTTVDGTERFRLDVDHASLVDGERACMDGLLARISEAYRVHRDSIDDMKVRAMVRDYLRIFQAVQLKPSVYFIPIAQVDNLRLLQELVTSLPNKCVIRLIPLIDVEEQRDMVVEAFETETVSECGDLVAEVMRLRETRTQITPAAYAKIRARYDELLERTTTYSQLLDDAQTRTKGATMTATLALRDLMHLLLEGSK